MLRVLFWNAKKLDDTNKLIPLCLEMNPEILILAECEVDERKMRRELSQSLNRQYSSLITPSGRLSYFYALGPGRFTPRHDSDYFSIVEVKDPFFGKMMIVAVHLPSKLHRSSGSSSHGKLAIAEKIRANRESMGNLPAVIVGDFNMDPFEDAMVSAFGFHALMDKDIVRERNGERKVDGQKYQMFYNPLWGSMGDTSAGPKGTYFYRASEQIAYFWHSFDQVLVTSELVDLLGPVRVIDRIEGLSFADKKGRPDRGQFSDHFPIYFELHTIRRSV